MTRDLHLVFSAPPADLPDEEYDAWYDAHVEEILAVPGFVSARRFRLDPQVQDPAAPSPYRFMALYEIEGDPDDVMAALAGAGLGSADLYVDLKGGDAGPLPLPPWFTDVRFASWNCIGAGEPITAKR
jgi:hypothetical protein